MPEIRSCFMRLCFNCKNSGMECRTFAMYGDPKLAYGCKGYKEEEHYCPSATNGDYSPSSPWNAPGMSVSDFI